LFLAVLAGIPWAFATSLFGSITPFSSENRTYISRALSAHNLHPFRSPDILFLSHTRPNPSSPFSHTFPNRLPIQCVNRFSALRLSPSDRPSCPQGITSPKRRFMTFPMRTDPAVLQNGQGIRAILPGTASEHLSTYANKRTHVIHFLLKQKTPMPYWIGIMF
jgi:hypothetical protein